MLGRQFLTDTTTTTTRSTTWHEHPQRLHHLLLSSGSPSPMRSAISHVRVGDDPTTVYTAHVGRAAAEAFGQASTSGSGCEDFFSSVYDTISTAIGLTVQPVLRKGRGPSTKLSFVFPSAGSPEATHLRRTVSHSGQWAHRFNGSDVLIPIDIAEPLLPLHRLSLRFLDVPLPFSTVNLPSVILAMAGYRVIMADTPDDLVPPGSPGVVYILLFRLGMVRGPTLPDPSTFLYQRKNYLETL